MKKTLFVLLVFACSVVTEAQNNNYKNLDRFFNKLESENKAMGTISVVKNGKEIYQKNIGYANLKTKTRPNKYTKYRIGSITKTFTAAIILQQIDEGKLTLNTLLKEFFPEIPNAHKITIEDLLRHQSGLTNITQDKTIISWISKPQTRKQMIDRFIKNGTVFEPKEKSSYSNTNFAILSYISEKIDSRPFATILYDRIIQPLGLKRTEFGKTIQPNNNEANSYYLENNQWNLINFQTHMSAPMGAGAIVSTSSNIATFYTSLFTNKLISKSSLKELMTIKRGFGLGISQFKFKGLKVYGHDGGIDGFQSYALYIPEKNVSMAFTFNGLNMLMMPLVISILDNYFEGDTSLKKQASIKLSSKDLDAYLGVYSGKTFPAKVTFTKKGSTLFAQATGQPIFKLTATKKDFFMYDAMGIRFDFNLKNNTLELTFAGNKHLLKKE
ncbi:MAG: serine hydrolase [Flavobacteriaceae bacterium]|nr:serine hydrolase [Flavobacteriaceae bacterium]